jgi:hypothetical protein
LPHQQQQYLGGGHFGEVYLEMDTGLGRPCAAKYLDPSLLVSGAEAFAEAKAMVTAEHGDYVVAVYSAQLEGGRPVIRMEYLPEPKGTENCLAAPCVAGRRPRRGVGRGTVNRTGRSCVARRRKRPSSA